MTLADIKEIVIIVSLCASFIGTFLAALAAFRKTSAEASSLEVKTETDQDEKEVSLTERMNKMSADLLKQMDDRYNGLRSELEVVRSDLRQAQREKEFYRLTGLRVLLGIEASLTARNRLQADGQACGACLTADHKLLTEIAEVKKLFEMENPSYGNTADSSGNS